MILLVPEPHASDVQITAGRSTGLKLNNADPPSTVV
jgi:hypothetical protein